MGKKALTSPNDHTEKLVDWDSATLLEAATRRERNSAGACAKTEKISFEEALLAILTRKTKKEPLAKFIAARLRQRQKEKQQREKSEQQRQEEIIIKQESWRGWFDGAAEPTNPGPRGIGGLLVSPDGSQRIEISRAIGYGTNNEAEYAALIAVLEQAIELNISRLIVYGDSALVINQVSGDWRVNSPNLCGLCRKSQHLTKNFSSCGFRWVRREQNKEADRLSKKALRHDADGAHWGNQTDIGKVLGFSAVAVGKLLKECGFRTEDGKASQQAVENGLARLIVNKFGIKLVWNIEKTAEILSGSQLPLPEGPLKGEACKGLS